jgi:SAM-dependent methyltransferase
MPEAETAIGFRRFLRGSRVSGSVRDLVAGVTRRLFPAQPAKHPFDAKHKVDTSGLIYAEALAWGHEHDHESAGYYATAPSIFHRALARWSEALAGSAYEMSDYTFVDIGCGKGRVVMMASEYAFREIVGVELNPGLAKIARKNLRMWTRSARACSDLRLVKGDALSFPLPGGPVVLFFFNSFEREMVRMWLERLVDAAASRSAPIDLIYVHPEHRDVFHQTPAIELLADEVMPFSEEDAAADVFGVAMDRFAVYRMPGSCLGDVRLLTRVPSPGIDL